MKLSKYIFLYAFFLMTVIGCTSNEPQNIGGEPDDDAPPSTEATVNVADDNFINYIIKVDENTIFLNSSIPERMLPKIGNILVIPQCSNAEFGFAGIVRRIIHDNNIEILTDTPSLDQLAEEFKLTNKDFDAEVYDVTDDEGNAIDYELERPDDSRAPDDADNMVIRFPFRISSFGSDNLEIDGHLSMGFQQFSVNFLRERGRPLVSIFDIKPTLDLSLNSKVGVKVEKSFSKRIGQVRIVLRAAVPPGIPIIIPITFYVYAEADINGEISTTFTFNPHFEEKYHISSETGEWKFSKENNETTKKSPWLFSSFDVKGSISLDLKCGVIIGLYSATTGIGVNFIPKYTISAEASLNSDNLYKVNPLVTNNISLNSEAYCVASIFGKQLGKASIEFPSTTLWEEKMTLLPEINDFSVQMTDKTSSLVSYRRGKHFFLNNFAASEGISLFIADTEKHIADYDGSDVMEDTESIYKEHQLSNLSAKTTYAVCPYYEVFDKKYYGEKQIFNTEETYENRKYKITILSCDYEKLMPPQTSFVVDVIVDSNGNFIKVVNPENPNRSGFTKTWYYQNKRTDNGNRSDVLTEHVSISFNEYHDKELYCINTNHSHSSPNNGIEFGLSYEYWQWYGYNIDGPHNRYSYVHDHRNVSFSLDEKCGTFTPCSGWYYVLDNNTIYDCLYKAYAKMERIE